MERRTALVTAGLNALTTTAAAAAIATNVGLLGLATEPAVAGSLEIAATASDTMDEQTVPAPVETVYVDVYETSEELPPAVVQLPPRTIEVQAAPAPGSATDDREHDEDDSDDSGYEEFEGAEDDD